MALMKNLRLAAIIAMLMTTVCNCQKSEEGQGTTEPEVRTNYFVYDGYSFDINSVVKYEQGNNSVELWLSPISGAKTIAEIESGGDYVVLNTDVRLLGSRDRFNTSTSVNSFISFGSDKKFAYGEEGTAYIQVSIDGDVMALDFLAQNLYTKASDHEFKAALHGNYSGAFIIETEKSYDNAWGINRNHAALTGASYTTCENGNNSYITLFAEDSKEAFKITFSPAFINKNNGKSIQLPNADIKLTYNEVYNFNIAKASGSFLVSITDSGLEIGMDMTDSDSGKRFRANYKGACESKIEKLNRYIFNYDGTSLVGNGSYEIAKLMVDNNGTACKLYMSPSEGYFIAGSNSTHMPILTIPSSIINAGKKAFTEFTDWKFEFVEMQVWPFENDEYKPHPASTDWIQVNNTDNVYEVEFVLSGVATGMPACTIDVYYKGEAK